MKCINCNGDIEEARLEAVPNTEFCIKCARTYACKRAKEVRYADRRTNIEETDEASTTGG